VLSLMGEMQQAEELRARERQLILGRRRESRAVVPRAALESARNVLEEGSVALVAAHEHTLRLVDMRLAAMGEQLARRQSALPVGRASHEELQQPPSPTSSVSLARGLSSDGAMRAVEQHGAALSERVVSTFQPLQPVASPWPLVSSLGDALGRTPLLAGFTGGGGRKSARLSLAGHQALAGALQSAFAKHPILAALSSDWRRNAAGACMREVRVKAGAVVAAQGAECEAFAIVGSGVFDG
jgi:hypothetical protein